MEISCLENFLKKLSNFLLFYLKLDYEKIFIFSKIDYFECFHPNTHTHTHPNTHTHTRTHAHYRARAHGYIHIYLILLKIIGN